MKRIFLIALAMLLLTACSGGSKQANVPDALEPVPAEYAGKSNPAGGNAKNGATLFMENCAACHGEKADGNSDIAKAITPPPSNLVELKKKAGDDYLFWRISTGRPATAMAPWNHLGDENIWDLVAYLRTLE